MGVSPLLFVCLFVRVITIHQPALHVSAAAPNQYTTPGPKVIKEAWDYQHDSDSRTEKNDQRKKMNKSRARVLAQRLFTTATVHDAITPKVFGY